MTYYKCKRPGCGHTTADHAHMGMGQCLIEGCECGEMDKGEAIATPKEARATRDERIAAAKKRSEGA
jgi:hypothetical protein